MTDGLAIASFMLASLLIGVMGRAVAGCREAAISRAVNGGLTRASYLWSRSPVESTADYGGRADQPPRLPPSAGLHPTSLQIPTDASGGNGARLEFDGVSLVPLVTGPGISKRLTFLRQGYRGGGVLEA
jgi:hypothetical protein